LFSIWLWNIFHPQLDVISDAWRMGVIGGVMGVRVCVFVLNGCNRAHVVPFSSKDVARISPIQTSRRICGKKAHGETSRPAIS